MAHKLLLADDSVTIQRVIELTFAGEDVEVIAVGDGQKAIDRIGKDRPDIVLTDIGMPERNGYEVAEFVKTHPDLKHIPVVLLSGAFESVDEARVRAIGCDGWLVKPFEPQLVINRVRDLLQGRGSGASWTPPPGQRPSSKAQAAEQPREVPAAPPAAPAPRPAAPERPPSSTAARPSPAPAVRAMASAPTTVAKPPKPVDAMEEYFDRLDAAFANLDTPHPPQSDDRRVEDGRDQELHRGEPSGSQKPGEEPENWDLDTAATDDSAPQTSNLAAASDSDRTATSPTKPRAPSVPLAPSGRRAQPTPPAPSVRRAPATPPAPPVKETAQSPQPAHAPGRAEPSPAPIDTGPQGLQGLTSDAGPQGPKGETGPHGPQGEIGPQGPKGDTGDTGSVPTPSLADAFTALLAAEQRIPGWSGTTQPGSQAGAPAIPDGLVEELTRRVLDRVTDQGVRDVVGDTVSQVAERLVRDEIEQIKTKVK